MQNLPSLPFVATLSRKFHRAIIVLISTVAGSMSSSSGAAAEDPIVPTSAERMSVSRTIVLVVRCAVLLGIVILALYLLVSGTIAALAGASELGCVNAG